MHLKLSSSSFSSSDTNRMHYVLVINCLRNKWNSEITNDWNSGGSSPGSNCPWPWHKFGRLDVSKAIHDIWSGRGFRSLSIFNYRELMKYLSIIICLLFMLWRQYFCESFSWNALTCFSSSMLETALLPAFGICNMFTERKMIGYIVSILDCSKNVLLYRALHEKRSRLQKWEIMVINARYLASLHKWDKYIKAKFLDILQKLNHCMYSPTSVI